MLARRRPITPHEGTDDDRSFDNGSAQAADEDAAPCALGFDEAAVHVETSGASGGARYWSATNSLARIRTDQPEHASVANAIGATGNDSAESRLPLLGKMRRRRVLIRPALERIVEERRGRQRLGRAWRDGRSECSRLHERVSGAAAVSTAARKRPSDQKPKADRKKAAVSKRRPRASPELRRAADQHVSRAEAVAALYLPLREATDAELKSTKSGRNLLEEANQFVASVDKLSKGMKNGKTSPEEVDLFVREGQRQFRERYGEQLLDAQGRHAHLQPSVAAVAQILRPEMAANTIWVSETSPFGSMLLQPKPTPDDLGTVSQGLDDRRPPPPVQLSSGPPYYDHKEEHFLLPPYWNDGPPWGAEASVVTGETSAGGRCLTNGLVVHVEAALASAFVCGEFPVPKGPTDYSTTIKYDWSCSGAGTAMLGVTVINVDLAIVIDNLDGTRETHAREVSLFTVPVAGGDSFGHESPNATVTIPFKRSGLNGTTRIWAGVDGHCVTVAVAGYCYFLAKATIREISIEEVR